MNIALARHEDMAKTNSVSALAGTIYGINHITLICHVADTVATELRESVIRVIVIAKWFIILAFYLVFSVVDSMVAKYIFNAIVYSSLGFLIALLAFSLMQKSTVHSLPQKELDTTIKRRLARFHGENEGPVRAQRKFDGWKSQLNEDQSNRTHILANGNWRTLLLITVSRVVHVLINNIPMSALMVWYIHMAYEAISQDYETNYLSFSWLIFINLLAKCVLGTITLLAANCLRWDRFFYVAAIVWSVCCMIMAYLIHQAYEVQWIRCMAPMTVLLFWIIGLGVDAISYNQLAIAFPLNKRAASIACIQLVEVAAEIMLITIYLLNIWHLAAGCIALCILLCSLVLLAMLPNVYGRSSGIARDTFKGRNNL